SSVVLLLLVAFLLGVGVERVGWLPGSGTRPPGNLGDTFDPFWQTWRLVQKYYVDRNAVDPQRMTRGAIEGMLASLGDEGHTTYLSRSEYEQMERSLEGHLEGIGVRMAHKQHQLVAAGILPGSPAQAAGMKAGVVFLEVDGKDVTGLSIERLGAMVRGPA